MEVHGNKTWNNATDNKDKTLVPMAEDTFRKIQQRLDNSGINYFAYSKDGKTVMAINDKDIDWLKSLIGKDANRMEIRKSDVAYTPPHKNIIGNAEYRYIPQKEYISLDSDTALKMAELMEKQNIQFSGRVSAHGKTTLTVSHSDLEKVKGIQGNVIAIRRQFAKDEKADEIIGNKAYRDIHERHYFHSKMKPEEYKEIQPFLETSAEYSGLIRDGKVIFTVEQNEASQFYMALESAHREAEIYSDLAESGLGEEHISQMKDIIHQASIEDIHISLDNFFDERYSDEQFSEMIKLTEKYLAQSPAERMGKETVLEDMLKAKHDFDRNIEMDEYFSEHSYSDEQKALITDMFMNNESRTLIDAIDESFTPFDIQQYNRIIHNYNEPGDVTDFLNNHRMLASLPFADRYADEIEEMSSFLSSNERIIETAAQGDYNEYLYAFNEEFVNHVLLSDNKNFSDSFFTNFNELNIDFTNSIFGELKEKIFDETERHHEKSEPVRPDSISFSYGKDKEWFTESSILADFAEKNPEISFALANAVFEYLDEKQHTERNIPELNAGWYKKTDFVISGVIGGENFNYEGRFDIGDGKGTGGGSLIDHIRDINQGILDSERYPYNTPDSKEKAQNTLDILIPFLETHSQLTAEEMKILSDFKAENPVRTEPELEPQQEFKIYQMKSGEEYHYNRFESLENNKGKINIDDYEVVYSGFMDEYTGNTLAEKLESIYAEFNTHLPDNYFGHSLSMSDVIVTDDKAFYVDTIGFAEFPEFFKEKEIVLSNDEHEKSEPAVNIPEQKREPVDRGPVTMRKVGDFYEMYGKNAEIGMEVLGLHNTPKNGSPMVGFPDHVKDEYSAKLGEAGYTVLTEDKPERTADDITVGDKYLLKSAFNEKEVTVTSMKGIYPDDVGITEYHKSGDMEYETTSNIDKFKLHRDGEYLGNVNDIQYEHEKNLAEEKTPKSVKMTVFHGTTRNFDTFRPDYRGAIWTETDFDIAKKYAGNVPESNVLTCEAELKNPAHFTFGSTENWDIDQTIREAMSKGHDSAIIDFKFAAGENHFYQYMLNNQPDTLASEFFNNIMGVSSADALEGETIGEFAKRMAENDNIIHSYVAVFNPDQVQIIDRTSVYENEETELDKAKNYINNFCIDEYSAEADFSDLSRISIAYTTDEETDLEIQVSADLEKYRLIYEYDGNVVRDEQYNSLSEMNENALSVLDYDDLVSFSEDEKNVAKTGRTSGERTNEKTTNDIEEDVPLFADADVIEEIQKSERAEENKPFHNTYGEQMSLFGFEEPVQKNIKPERKSEPKAKQSSQLFVGNINTMSALHDEILRGSGFHGGKLRIQKFYDENTPSTKEFADFLKKEYGVGGHSADDPIAFVDHDSKGIQFTLTDENGRFSDEKFSFKWTEVARVTAELIDKGEYLNDMEREKYSAVSAPEIISEDLFSQSDLTEETPAMVAPEAEAEIHTQQIKDIAEEPVVESEQPAPDKGENFTIKDTSLGEGGAKTKFKANIAAIETLKMLEKENRPATDEEKETLSKYVGWGGIPQAFDNDNDSWAAEYSQLKELLTPQEYRQANASVLDAFYTSPTVIDGIYEALENFGFEGGNVLEPAMGVGNFFGRMPEEMQKISQLYGVEIDSISGRIAQKLYPDADIAIQGFEKNNFQNGCFDVAVGNVPFGELGFKDDKHGTNKLHDYFFAETLDKIKDGGIVAFVTSAGTLDKRDETTRQMLADKADFIGGIRLPGGKNGAFKDNSGTEVTTDIIFLQKHNDKTVREMLDVPDWVRIGETADGLPINKYFEKNPDMVLGTVIEGNKLYGSGTMVVADDGFDLQTALHDAVSKLSAQISIDNARDVYAKSEDGIDVKIPSNLRNYSFFEQDNQIFFKKKENVCDKVYDSDNSQFKRAKAFIELRDTTRDLLEAQELDKPDSEIKALQDKLNSVYDDFYKKYGLLHSQSNKRYFSDDVSYNLVAGLEKKFDKNILEEKSDIFTKRTIQPPKAVEHVETALEALTLSVAETAGVDFEYMGKLTGMTEDELKKDLAGEIYKVPHTENSYQTASEYLSGDIRQKLKIAEEVAEYDSDFNINVNALKKAMPEPLKAGDIDVKIGAAWLEPKYYEQFMYETFQTPRDNRADCPTHSFWRKPKNITAEYSEQTGTWHIENKNADRSVITTQQFGSKKMNAYDIMEHLLNLKDPKIYKMIEVPDGMGDTKEKRVVDIDATRVVQKKADKIKSEFKKWIFKDQERRETIVEKYNQLFNSVRPREYDGSNLSFPMMNSDIKLHDHQKNAIAHAMFGGNTLFAHSVGAGKTFEMIATAMESKRLGLCTKSMFAVPNHLTEQIGDDFQKLYPSANVLVATKKDFQKENRQQLFAKIATGNFDAVIIGHSQLGMIPISKERQENMLQSQISDIVEGIKELKKQEGSKFQIKTMERTKKSLEKNLDKLQKNHDDTITFEQLGVDKLFVDEAHEFKNLFTPTKLNNISGISNSASQKALDLFMKCQYLDEKTDGKGVVFATGTPLSNSVTELHTMMRYLEYDFLKEHGLANFDNWVTVFGEQKTDWELAPAGNKFKERTRIANYTGLPELMSMFKQIADIRTADSLKLDVPDCEYKIVNVEATPFQKELVDELADRADAINAGNVDPSIDNMLKITSDGRKLGLDPRLIDSSFEDNPDTKLNKCVENVARIHAETAEDKLTQIIFCDLGVPHKNNTSAAEKDGEDDSKSSAERDSLEEECDFCVYDDIKQKLIDKGIPESEIAYIHNAKTEKQKSELFDKVRSGEVRVLLGSTAKMGTGTNVQKKLIAVHDLDIPWRPADLEQRAGRIIRQGNENKNVQIYRYVTKGTFDAYSYQTLENKQKFISQIMTSKTPARKCEDVDQQALSYSEIKALCTGDERIKEKLMLDNEVKELKVLSSEHQNTVYEMQDKIKAFPEKEQRLTNSLDNLRTDREHLRTLPIDTETKLPVFKITIGETEYKDKKEAAKAFEDTVLSISKADTPVKVGEFQGFPLSVTVHSPYMGGGISATMNGAYPHTTKLIESFAHNLRRLEGCLYNIDRKIDDVNNNLAKLRVDHTEAQKIVSEPFPQADELAEKEERLKTLTDELNQAAIEAKKNAPKKEKTCYFERAKLKKEAARIAKKKSEKSVKNKAKSRDT